MTVAEVNLVAQAFHDGVAARDAAALTRLYHDDARFLPPNMEPAEGAIGWPLRRLASVLGGVSHRRHTEFGGRRPYRFLGDRDSASGSWEIWMDAAQAAALAGSDTE